MDRTAHPLTSEHEHEEQATIIQVVEGPDRGQEVLLVDDAITIGKAEGASLRLSDPTVSRVHLRVSRTPEGARVRDLGSTNGTWLGTAQLFDAIIPSGTRLRLGTTEITLSSCEATIRRLAWAGQDRLGPLVGGTPAMHSLFARLAQASTRKSRVLLRGEQGSGKELVARTLHEIGDRAEGPFVVLDGAALSDPLAEDELFGHLPGAFSGATGGRAGAFERASGGTLLLDEIADLSPGLQAKLVRALEDGTIQPLGSGERRKVDVVVIAATEKPLEQMVNERSFREDLYDRLASVELRVPALRERLADIPALAREVLRLEGLEGEPAKAAMASVQAALAALSDYPWPGNVRELRSFVRRVAVLGPTALPAPLGDRPRVLADLPFQEAKEHWLAQLERRYMETLLDETAGNITEAALRSGVSAVHLSNLAFRKRRAH